MIKKIPVDELKPGMCVATLDSSVWRHAPFLYTRPGYVRDVEEVERIRSQGYLEVFIDTSRGLAEEEPEASEEERLEQALSGQIRRERSAPGLKVPMPEELPRAHRRYQAALTCARRIAEAVLTRRPLDLAAAEDAVEEIIDSVARNPGALLCLSKLHRYDSYTYTHSANVCSLAVLFGTYLGLDRDRLLELGLAGLFHDVGMVVVPREVVAKHGPLTREELDLVKTHPTHGRRLLAVQARLPQPVLRGIAEHHEQYNGKGYPLGLMADQISHFGRVLALCNTFDALTSERSYMKSLAPSKALALMYTMRGQNFSTAETELFIKCLGIYPSGSLVRLNTGDYGVVYETSPSRPLLPAVNVILDKRMRPRPPRVVDLAAHAGTGKPELKIEECLNPLNYLIDLRRYLGADIPLN